MARVRRPRAQSNLEDRAMGVSYAMLMIGAAVLMAVLILVAVAVVAASGNEQRQKQD